MTAYKDKFKFSKDQNRRFAKLNLSRLVFTNSRFEGINATLLQIETIINGLGVDGMALDDISIIVQLKRGWQFVYTTDQPVSLETAKQINAIVAKEQSLDPGNLRTGNGLVRTMDGDFIPPLVNEVTEAEYLRNLVADDSQSVTERAIELMYHLMRNQIFWDGNKRTVTLMANLLMIDGGSGLINVPLPYWSEWNKLISEYYQTGEIAPLKALTYEHAIQGIDSFTTPNLKMAAKA